MDSLGRNYVSKIFDGLFEEMALGSLKFKGATSYNVKRYQQNMTKKPGPERKLKPENELLLTLMKIKLDLLYEDLAFRFDITVS